MRYGDNHPRSISQETLQQTITNMSLPIIYLKFDTNVPGSNELTPCAWHSSIYLRFKNSRPWHEQQTHLLADKIHHSLCILWCYDLEKLQCNHGWWTPYRLVLISLTTVIMKYAAPVWYPIIAMHSPSHIWIIVGYKSPSLQTHSHNHPVSMGSLLICSL